MVKSYQAALKTITSTVKTVAEDAPEKFSASYLKDIKDDLIGAYVDLLMYFGVDVDPSELDNEDNPQFEDFETASEDSKGFGSFGAYIAHAAWQYMADTFDSLVDDSSDDPEATRVLDFLSRKAMETGKVTRGRAKRNPQLTADLRALAQAIRTIAGNAPEGLTQGYMDKATDRIQDLTDQVFEDCGLRTKAIQADYDADSASFFAGTDDYVGYSLWGAFYSAFESAMVKARMTRDIDCDAVNSFAVEAQDQYNTRSYSRNESYSYRRRYW